MATAVHTPLRPTSVARRASTVPLLVAVAAIIVSISIAAIAVTTVSAPVTLIFDLSLPLVVTDAWWLSLLGYLLTPTLVIACYGWDAIAQRNGVRQDVNFVQRPGYGTALRGATVGALVVGAWHVLNLSVPLSEAWGLS